MHFGMPVLIENKNLEENLILCRELGLDFVELNMNLPEYQIEQLEDVSRFREAAEQYGIYFTIHLDENLNIADFNRAVSDAYMDTVKRTIGVAERLRVPVLNMHMHHGVYFTLPDRKVCLFEQYSEAYMEAFERFLHMCEAETGSAAIKLCIENTDGFRAYEKSAIGYLLRSGCFGLTWDIGHSNSCGNVDEAFLLAHEDKLCHFHIHDSLGGRDHMTLGTGEVAIRERLAVAAEHDCRCVVETKTVDALRESVQWLRRERFIR